MATSGQNWGWKLGIVSWLVMGGAIASCENYAIAQIAPDNTLGAESSVVTPNAGNVDEISGGATRGANLFHSFEQFSVLTGREAFFNNNASIQNIISRVTGGSISNIDGLLRANGTANLFLINPNGISFGPNASLNIGGSFVGSTASAINFADGTQFSATALQSTPLLTVSVPVGLQYGVNPGRVLVQGNGQGTRTTTELIDTTAGLRVQPNQTLALVGGDVTLEGGTLKTAGGRIELGSVAGAGLVNLTPTNTGWGLGYEGVPTFGDIQLSQQATVDASGAGGGDIQVQGRRLTLTNGSRMEASTLRAEPGGTLNVIASGSVEASGWTADGQFRSGLFAQVYSGAVGKGGDINITTGSLSLTDSDLSTNTLGAGNAGNVTINAKDTVSFDRSDLSSNVGDQFGGVSLNGGAVSQGGDINITAGSLLLTNYSNLSSSTYGKGNAGNVTINATDTVSFYKSDVSSSVGDRFGSDSLNGRAVGKGGDINITTRSLSLTDSDLSTNTLGAGDAGNVTINAKDTVSFYESGVSSSVGDRFGSHSASEEVVGNGGDINITTGSLSFNNTSDLDSSTSGKGNAGNVTINAKDTVSFDLFSGVSSDVVDQFGSHSASEGVVGNGGNINITTGSLSLTNLSNLSSVTRGKGNAGNVTINATDTVSFDLLSGVSSDVEEGSVGNGGSINITTGSLSLTNLSNLSSVTSGKGNAGNVTINATDTVSFDNSSSNVRVFFSSYSASEGAVGNGGSINITTGSLSLTNGASLLSNTLGQGNAGSVNINARDTVSFHGVSSDGSPSSVSSSVLEGAMGTGGGINIQTGSLSVTNGAQLHADNDGRGNPGSVNINARDTVLFDGKSSDGSLASGAYSAVGSEAVSKGGGINITTGSLSVTNGAQLGAFTLGQGDAGSVNINARDTVFFDGESVASSSVGSEAVGKGGGINITTGSLSVANGAHLDAFTLGQGDAGSVNINARDTVSFDGVGSDGSPSGAFSSVDAGAVGNGGSIEITTGSLSLTDGARISTSSIGSGAAGNIEVAADSIRLDNDAFLTSNTIEGQGNITLRSEDLVLRRGSNITTNATGADVIGGNITIDTGVLAALENSDIGANSVDFRGGNVTINAQGIVGTQFRDAPTPESDITATGGSPELSGTVEINNLDVDPEQGLVELPAELADASNQIASGGCTVGENKFSVVGRGGLPPNPREPLNGEAVLTNWATLEGAGSREQGAGSREQETDSTNSTSYPPTEIVEATGWITNDKGEVVLTAASPTATLDIPWLPLSDCHASKP